MRAIHGSNTARPLSNTLPTRSKPSHAGIAELMEYDTTIGMPLVVNTSLARSGLAAAASTAGRRAAWLAGSRGGLGRWAQLESASTDASVVAAMNVVRLFRIMLSGSYVAWRAIDRTCLLSGRHATGCPERHADVGR
ncbi:hypothetical protein [Burkholderia stagnalis]|uniref:hypothetical protein n=2 Tax=Burkholderia stagnalis TaxID=1503054 RepID=UPI0012DA045D|nr:hypothetical protein [Burkholderia stagnalis]